MKLNLGCGNDNIKGYTNLDIKEGRNVNIVHNLNEFPYPFKDNTIEEIRMSHILEHLDNPINTLHECHRILKRNGVIKIIVPYFTSMGAYSPYHKTYYSTAFLSHLNDTADNKDSVNMFNIEDVYIKFIKGKMFWNYVIEYLINRNKTLRGIYEHSLCWIFPAVELKIILINK